MCQAFSCIIGKDKKVWWEFGIDSHEEMIQKAGYQDDTKDTEKIQFARIEISPKNRNYLDPDRWAFKIDMDIQPAWWTNNHEKKCWTAFQKWKKKLDAALPSDQKIIHPFRDVPPVTKVTKEQLKMLRDWDLVWDSVGDSVRASVGAYIGSLFRIPRKDWKYTEKIPGDNYPFQPAVPAVEFIFNLGYDEIIIDKQMPCVEESKQ